MKKSRFSKIAALLLTLTIAVGALFSVSIVAGAEGAEPYLGYSNVMFGDTIKLAFTVEGDGIGIAVYSDEDKTTLVSKDTTPETDASIPYYTTAGIAAKDIDKTYYIGVIDANGNVGELTPYSVLQYVNAKDAETPDVAEDLYVKIRAYNAAANAVFGE